MRNEAATIRYIQKNTTIPTPNIRCAFEDHGRYYIVTDFVPGVAMVNIPEDKKAIVIDELRRYIDQMHAIKSTVIGGVLGHVVVLPHRLAAVLPGDKIPQFREAPTAQFVMCHNDLSQYKCAITISLSTTLWSTRRRSRLMRFWIGSTRGFFRGSLKARNYLRPGPSAALEGEED